MTRSEIQIGGHYLARVSGKLVTVRVEDIREFMGSVYGAAGQRLYDVTNLTTGRKTTFRSAAKFRHAAPAIFRGRG